MPNDGMVVQWEALPSHNSRLLGAILTSRCSVWSSACSPAFFTFPLGSIVGLPTVQIQTCKGTGYAEIPRGSIVVLDTSLGLEISLKSTF